MSSKNALGAEGERNYYWAPLEVLSTVTSYAGEVAVCGLEAEVILKEAVVVHDSVVSRNRFWKVAEEADYCGVEEEEVAAVRVLKVEERSVVHSMSA
jgi:hypothetical protein